MEAPAALSISHDFFREPRPKEPLGSPRLGFLLMNAAWRIPDRHGRFVQPDRGRRARTRRPGLPPMGRGWRHAAHQHSESYEQRQLRFDLHFPPSWLGFGSLFDAAPHSPMQERRYLPGFYEFSTLPAERQRGLL